MSEQNCDRIKELATLLAESNMKVGSLMSATNDIKFEQKSIRFMKAVNDYMEILEKRQEIEEQNIDS